MGKVKFSQGLRPSSSNHGNPSPPYLLPTLSKTECLLLLASLPEESFILCCLPRVPQGFAKQIPQTAALIYESFTYKPPIHKKEMIFSALPAKNELHSIIHKAYMKLLISSSTSVDWYLV